ncbi:urea carboxylase [Falsirhodobacter halotolerans]|uniref:urea carboxylase n=1 Tax=Falsirhodobacter halotolerans TaxID=1146892 RepID=UPI001FD46A8F|nr:urea carboxylase [Falsirhodobacter halotolerans]MCJ8139104.1 urea carboxylase [Falsirhodobacter halotolerans]
MFHTVLVANRGEIACRILRTLKVMGLRTVAIHSDADADAPHVTMADVAVRLPGDKAADTYLRGDLILDAAQAHGAQAIIPGYGFLSENADFAEACATAGIVFVGPTAAQIRQFGLKHTSRELAAAAGVPLVPGTDLLPDLATALAEAGRIGFPVMLKSTAGGGGIGMVRCADAAGLEAAFDTVRRQALNFFKDAGVFLEACIDDARHVEVQIFGDGQGTVVALGERDCSLQRRNQKVVEETPAPDLPAATRTAMLAAARDLGASVGYQSAGTVEFIYDRARDAFYFLEVNARLQVEHPVTEAVLGIDLVDWMIRTAAGTPPDLTAVPAPNGSAIEVRIYAEDPVHDFQPAAGELTEVRFPHDVRVDGWVDTGSRVTPYYDPMIAKLIVHGTTRADAIAKMRAALDASRLSGIATNLDYLRTVVASEVFTSGKVSTRALSDLTYAPRAVEVVVPGTYTTVQDYPGRTGLWHIGVPPSGPMDDFAFRLANRIVGNDAAAAGLECTLAGPTLRFHTDTVVALTGASAEATLDGVPVAFWAPIAVTAGQVLTVGKALSGCRTYVAVAGGLDVPEYLGSRSTFVLGQFGGHAGRVLHKGDVIPLGTHVPRAAAPTPKALIPTYGTEWEVGVLYGPHGAPDFFTSEAIETFFATDWEVHYNSNRLGVRLMGPKPTWARSDGGEAGLHPSNIHDTEYAIGAINFTGDMPVILTRDGPSLGGFVCPATIAKAELWKIGQAKPGDRIRFMPMTFDDALALERAQDAAIDSLTPLADLPAPLPPSRMPVGTVSATVLAELPAQGDRPAAAYRQAGDRYILLEYGPNELDLRFRFRIHALMKALTTDPIDGVLELSPGIRSLQINYDGRVIHQRDLIARLLAVEETLTDTSTMKVPTRVIHLPMAFEDSATLDAQTRYRETVRATAPWMPNNVDFIQRINGLSARDQVREIVFSASYMVMGLGDVYLGAPCAVPIDPRHRLLTSKYNPARTFTAEGTVGIGGVYMCIYGMDSPGGYQLVGRTLPIWNKFTRNPCFAAGEPWLLRFFDQVRYYEVTEEELQRLRADFREGRATVRIEEEEFDLGAYHAFLEAEADSIAAFKAGQSAAFRMEVARWQEDDALAALEDEHPPEDEVAGDAILAELHGSIWKVLVDEGQIVAEGQPIIILEAMKTEITVTATVAGTVARVHARPGRTVATGDRLLVIEAH